MDIFVKINSYFRCSYNSNVLCELLGKANEYRHFMNFIQHLYRVIEVTDLTPQQVNELQVSQSEWLGSLSDQQIAQNDIKTFIHVCNSAKKHLNMEVLQFILSSISSYILNGNYEKKASAI